MFDWLKTLFRMVKEYRELKYVYASVRHSDDSYSTIRMDAAYNIVSLPKLVCKTVGPGEMPEESKMEMYVRVHSMEVGRFIFAVYRPMVGIE